MVNKNKKSEEIIQPPKPEKRKLLSESEISELEKSERAEVVEKTQGHIGPQEYYKAPQPLVYMPRTLHSDELVHDMETQKLIEDGLRDIENLREQMERERLEIERLKNETRVILAKLLMA